MALVDSVGDQIHNLGPRKLRRPNIFFRFVKNIVLILFFSSVVFATINYPAYAMITKYQIDPSGFAFGAKQQEELSQANSSGEYKPTKQYPDSTLFIPKIGVTAPVNYDVSSGDVKEKLKTGVVHLKGTGHISDEKNTFITGHSSNYWWENGDYNTVFALLPKLEKGDLIYLTDSGQLNRFVVKDKIEVNKQEVDKYLESANQQLTLMTCIPIGTNLRRLLVFAVPD